MICTAAHRLLAAVREVSKTGFYPIVLIPSKRARKYGTFLRNLSVGTGRLTWPKYKPRILMMIQTLRTGRRAGTLALCLH